MSCTIPNSPKFLQQFPLELNFFKIKGKIHQKIAENHSARFDLNHYSNVMLNMHWK